MGNTATITHQKATITSFALGADGRIIIADQNTGPRTQSYDQPALAASSKCCPPESEGHAMYKQREVSVTALDAQTPALTIQSAPGLGMKQSPS